jgi:prepilin-type N-terminal cleavage/methylation domain-containing protein
MTERLQRHREGEEGFTLVELLVVIVILGILAAIVVFAVGGITNKGTNAANATDVSVLQAAEEAAFAQSTATTPLYVTESYLFSNNFLRTLSTKSLLCLTPSAAAATDYKVIAMPATVPTTQTQANTACGATYVGSMGIATDPDGAGPFTTIP